METDDMELDLSKYVDVLRRWLRLLILGPLLAGAVALAVSFLLPPVYEAEADVASVKSFSQISLSPDYKTLSEAQLTQGLDMAARQKALVAIARGNEIASAVVAELGPGLGPEERDIAKLVTTVNVSTDGDLMRIKVQNKDPEKAAQIANSWAANYASRVNQLYTESPTSLDQVQAQARVAWQNYQAAESAFNQFIGISRLDDISREIAARQNTINDLYAVQRNLDRVLADARSLQDLLAKNSSISESDAGNRLAALLIQTNAATLSYLASSTNPVSSSNLTFSSNPAPSSSSQPAPNPATSPVQIQIASTSLGDMTPAELRQQIESLIAVLEAQRRQVESRLADPTLQSQILALQKESEQQIAKKQELATARDIAWSAYKTMAGKIEEVRMAQQSSSTIVRVAGSAMVPSQPVAPKKAINALLAALVGLMLSIGIAFAVEFLDPSIRSSQELARDLNVPTFEVQPSAIAQANASIKSERLGASPVPPVYYQIWANLFLGAQPCGKTLLVANLGRAQDSGSVIANLGLIAAQAGRSVILVDSNVLCPSLNQIFGIPNTHGWGNLLEEEHADIVSYLQPTSVKNLMVLTGGTSPSHMGQAVVSPRLASAISALQEKAALVLFTSASPSSAVDALLIGKQVEGVLLVVAARVTLRDAVLQFREQLQNVGANVLGAIVLQTQEGPLMQFRHIINPTRRQRTADQFVSPVSAEASREA